MSMSNIFLDSVTSVKKKIKDSYGITAGATQIHNVMRNELKMRYRKVKPLSMQANSEQNLILRQRFALEFLKLDLGKKTIINIDETWLGMSDFRHTKWCLPYSTNSFSRLQIQPRISMILALDSKGVVRICLVRSNTNSKVMSVYFYHLT